MWDSYKNSRFVVWIRVKVDPHARFRGFSILNREMRIEGFAPVESVMQDFRGETMSGKFWVVPEDEVMRAIPELRSKAQGKAWFFPFEFCESFVRPYNFLNFKVKETQLLWDDDEEDT